MVEKSPVCADEIRNGKPQYTQLCRRHTRLFCVVKGYTEVQLIQILFTHNTGR
jgi:hypothetical protein